VHEQCMCGVYVSCIAIVLLVVCPYLRSVKSKKHNDWFRSSAKAMDLILDESLYPN